MAFIKKYTYEIFKRDGSRQKCGGKENEQEDIEVLETGFDQAFAMIGAGEIKDAKTIMLLQYIKIRQIL